MEAIIEDGLAAINALIDSTRDIADPHQQITLLIERSFNAMAREQHFWKLLMSLLLQPDIWADFHTRFDDFFREATADFAAIFERMGVADPQAEALLIAALLDGVGLHYFMDQQHYPLDTVKNALIKRYSHSEVKRQRS